jgi:hypothetical protein
MMGKKNERQESSMYQKRWFAESIRHVQIKKVQTYDLMDIKYDELA